jgi:hypothetical protein
VTLEGRETVSEKVLALLALYTSLSGFAILSHLSLRQGAGPSRKEGKDTVRARETKGEKLGCDRRGEVEEDVLFSLEF